MGRQTCLKMPQVLAAWTKIGLSFLGSDARRWSWWLQPRYRFCQKRGFSWASQVHPIANGVCVWTQEVATTRRSQWCPLSWNNDVEQFLNGGEASSAYGSFNTLAREIATVSASITSLDDSILDLDTYLWVAMEAQKVYGLSRRWMKIHSVNLRVWFAPNRRKKIWSLWKWSCHRHRLTSLKL